MSSWPTIAEPELLERLAMDDLVFETFVRTLATQIPPRDYDAAVLARAVGYPWERPQGSYRLSGGDVEPLDDMAVEEREHAIKRFTAVEGGRRLPVLAFGSNGAPEALERKFAHFPDAADRELLALTGRLHDFDVGVSPQPAVYGALPATLFPSPGTAVCATVLWVTPAQFTQLAWSEISYRLGRLRTKFEADEPAASSGEVLVFVSRFGAFAPDGELVALDAIPATGRTAAALTQEELLGVAASLVLGPGAPAELLVRAIFEDLGEVGPKIAAVLWPQGRPFRSERWTPFSPA